MVKVRSGLALLQMLLAACAATRSVAFVPAGSTSRVETTYSPTPTLLHAVPDKFATSEAKDPTTTRKDFLQQLGLAGVASVVAFGSPINNVAYAAEDVAVAETPSESSLGVAGIIQSANLRSLKRAEKQLSKLEFYAVENDYENMKLSIRNAPFSEVRKNSMSLIKEFSGNEDAADKLTKAYGTFIASVEKMDNTAGLGLRGRKLDKGELLKCYDAVKSSMAELIAVASEVSTGSS